MAGLTTTSLNGWSSRVCLSEHKRTSHLSNRSRSLWLPTSRSWKELFPRPSARQPLVRCKLGAQSGLAATSAITGRNQGNWLLPLHGSKVQGARNVLFGCYPTTRMGVLGLARLDAAVVAMLFLYQIGKDHRKKQERKHWELTDRCCNFKCAGGEKAQCERIASCEHNPCG